MALNYQTEDKQNFINRARFADNGKCGFVLKPDFLRDSEISYCPVSPSLLSAKDYPPMKIEVTIVSGQHIPKPNGSLEGEVIDPYVKVKSSLNPFSYDNCKLRIHRFKVRLRGHPEDERDFEHEEDGKKLKKNKGKTEHVPNNGFNPVWKETFSFTSTVPDLAFLEFKVKDYSKSGTDKDIGAFCSPLSMIQEGI